ncbi:gag-asp_proteas domain-containing protein [Gossypium australe]|uniref:Gag-asp_proteas domain-containing protein n=1 Tax=Gossypium australe TaxID=47621 RepID=A0A5B6VUJ1_9ROSI|nr:gag-asp_proteas domain-containing protein [Gossypium australe]
MTRRNLRGPLVYDSDIEATARRNRREIRRALNYTKEYQEGRSNPTEGMDENIPQPHDVGEHNAPRAMFDYAKPHLTGAESSIVKPAIMDLETLYDAWERYKDLLRRCSHHGLPLWLQVQTFYNGVNPSTRQLIDSAASGTLNNKTPEAAYEFIEEMSLNNYQWQVTRTKLTKSAGAFNIDTLTMLSTQMDMMNKKLDSLCSSQVHPVIRCDSSGTVANPEYPPYQPGVESEQMNYIEKKPNLEEMLTKLMEATENRLQDTEKTLKDQQTLVEENKNRVGELTKSVREVTKAVEQLAKLMSERQQGRLQLMILLTNKLKLDEERHVELSAVCSAMLQNRLPRKQKDPGSFIIPCLIGSLTVDNALADLGASINVMPYTLFKRLGLGKPKQTRMSIQLADKTVRIPRGIIEDVLVKIDKFVFRVDFVVLDMDEDNSIPLILEILFLATVKTKIVVAIGELILCVSDESISLQALDSARTTIDEGKKVNPVDNQSVQPSPQETPQDYKPESNHGPSTNKEELHKERSLRVEKLEEWKTDFKDETKPHKVQPEEPHEELIGTSNHFKIGDQVLLDKADLRITTSDLKANEEIPLEVHNIFPHETVEVSNPTFDTFKVRHAAWESRRNHDHQLKAALEVFKAARESRHFRHRQHLRSLQSHTYLANHPTIRTLRSIHI